jgi:hypothetical protein
MGGTRLPSRAAVSAQLRSSQAGCVPTTNPKLALSTRSARLNHGENRRYSRCPFDFAYRDTEFST